MSAVVREFEQMDDDERGTPLDRVEFAVVDLETTGTGARHGHRVTEIAIVTVRGRHVQPVFQTLVNPQRAIPWFITQLTGINDAMVRRAPTFAEVAGDVASHLAGRVFVAHNAAFDWTFLEAEYARLTSGGLAALASAQLCTVRLARRLLRHLPRRNLDAVCAHYGIAIDGRHRAGGDAVATAQVLVGLLRDAERAGIWSLEGLMKYGRRRVPRKKRRTAMPTWSDGADGA
ncbi:MAG TPA: 3'-5' exonuclease [Gemmatimonadaceae bacterium]|nr:3'-5' exonuclease [Gemmatimonadaceae bacterium]